MVLVCIQPFGFKPCLGKLKGMIIELNLIPTDALQFMIDLRKIHMRIGGIIVGKALEKTGYHSLRHALSFETFNERMFYTTHRDFHPPPCFDSEAIEGLASMKGRWLPPCRSFSRCKSGLIPRVYSNFLILP